MAIKLETNLSTKLLIILIPYLVAYPTMIVFCVWPLSDPTTFWLSFFTLWFGAGFFAVLWAGDDDSKQGLVAILWGLLILFIAVANISSHSALLYTILLAHGGISAGVAGSIFLFLYKRLIGRMRGLPPPTTRQILPVERFWIIQGTFCYALIFYLLLTWHSGLLEGLHSVWTWGGIILVGLWGMIFFVFYYRTFPYQWKNAPVPKWKPWQRYTLMILLVLCMIWLEVIVFSAITGSYFSLLSLSEVAYWSLAIALDALIGLISNKTGKDLENKQMKMIFFISVALAVLLIVTILPPLTGLIPWYW